MKKLNTALLMAAFTLTLSCSSTGQKSKTPSTTTPAQDQYWNELAIDGADSGHSIFRVLQENNPTLYNQIISDAKDPYLPMFWGQSVNFDSGAKKKIVNDQIIGELQARFNIKNDNHIVHAGIIHTYGYLFSTIDTPYGYKRKRWIAPTLNYAFGLTGNGLSPETIDGGLLSNVTYFAANIAFKDLTEINLLKNVSNEIFTFDYSKLDVTRIEESIPHYTIVTSLVKLPQKKAGEDNDYLLIYSTINHQLNKELLITVFPINTASYNGIVAKESLGPNQKITLRYNLYLEGVATNQKGTRSL